MSLALTATWNRHFTTGSVCFVEVGVITAKALKQHTGDFIKRLLLLTVMTIIGQGIPQIIGMLGLASGVANSRVVRAAVIGIKGNAYFEAAHAIGSPSWRTLLRHVWPNITAPIIIIYSITIGWAIIAEASLSFLGFGLPPDVPSWGTMLSREGRQYMEMAPRLAMWSGVALTLVVYCLNMVGDALPTCSTPGCAAAAARWPAG